MRRKQNIPQLRFSEFDDIWNFEYGENIFRSVSNKSHNSDLPILAITQEFGAIPRDLIEFKISVTDKSVESYKVVEVGDYIISLRSFQGGIEFSNYYGICSPAYIILKPIVEIDRLYFKFYFKTERYIKQITKNLEGIRDGKMISFKYFSDAGLNFPSLPEQTKIANFLTSVDEKLNQLKKKKSLLERYKKGVMQKIFSQELRFKDDDGNEFADWEEKKLGDIGDVKMCRRIFNEETLPDSDIPFYKIGSFGKKADAYISKELYLDYRKRFSFPKKGDILISAAGTIGRTVVYDGEDAYYQDSNIVWIDNDNSIVSNDFLFFILQIVKYNTEGGTIQRLYNNSLKSTKFHHPSLFEQTKIAKFLSAIDDKIQNCNFQIEKMELWKKGLLQKMFV